MTQDERNEKEFEEWWINKFDAPDKIKGTFGYLQSKLFAKKGWLASRRLLREKEEKDEKDS